VLLPYTRIIWGLNNYIITIEQCATINTTTISSYHNRLTFILRSSNVSFEETTISSPLGLRFRALLLIPNSNAPLLTYVGAAAVAEPLVPLRHAVSSLIFFEQLPHNSSCEPNAQFSILNIILRHKNILKLFSKAAVGMQIINLHV